MRKIEFFSENRDKNRAGTRKSDAQEYLIYLEQYHLFYTEVYAFLLFYCTAVNKECKLAHK